MSTRSLIAIQRKDDSFDTIYCHSDGYLTYNGAILIDHYKDRDKVERLIKLGDISSLAPNIDPDPRFPHSFDFNERQDDVVVAYARDRGDKNVESKILKFEDFKQESWIEYIYIFDTNNQWVYFECPIGDLDFKDAETVEKGVADEYKRMGIKRPPNCYGFLTDEELEKEKKRQKKLNQDTEM